MCWKTTQLCRGTLELIVGVGIKQVISYRVKRPERVVIWGRQMN